MAPVRNKVNGLRLRKRWTIEEFVDLWRSRHANTMRREDAVAWPQDEMVKTVRGSLTTFLDEREDYKTSE